MEQRLAAAMLDLFGIPEADLSPDAELETDLALDSLSVVELQVVLEEQLGVRISPDDPSAVRTLGDLRAVIEEAVRRGAPAMPPLQLSEDA